MRRNLIHNRQAQNGSNAEYAPVWSIVFEFGTDHTKMKKIVHCLAALALLSAPLLVLAAVQDASSEELGLYPAQTFRITSGKCSGCATNPQALWYFEQDLIGVPSMAFDGLGAVRTVSTDGAQDNFLALHAKAAELSPLVWLGSSKVLNNATLSANGTRVVADSAQPIPFAVVPKLSTNLSYYNADSAAFFAKRPVRLRGELLTDSDGHSGFVARTIWPQDFTINPAPALPLAPGETLRGLVSAEQGGAKSAYSTRVLWSRSPSQDWHGKAVVGLMLNGAQGDDDESLGGHFGVVTGKYTDGSFYHWLVNNFYGINSISEKGILAAVTPMDKYLMDLNNGQSYYRPSYLLVAILGDDHVPRAYQAHINRVFERFYRHEIEYDHANNNCSGITSDGFRDIGWNIPMQGNSDKIKAIPAYAYVAATKGSLREGRKIYDYLTAESTRLYPAVAFDAMGEDMLALAQNKSGRKLIDFEQELGRQLEAIVFVRIPQIPSSRAYGTAPVASFSEYQKQAPADQSQWKIVPTEPRRYPAEWHLQPSASSESPVPLPVAALVLIVLAGAGFGIRRLVRRK